MRSLLFAPTRILNVKPRVFKGKPTFSDKRDFSGKPKMRVNAVLGFPEPEDEDYKGLPDYAEGIVDAEAEGESIVDAEAIIDAESIVDADAADGAENFEKDLNKKYYYLDPAVIHYHRSLFEALFNNDHKSLTGTELKALAEGHRLQLTMKDQEVYLKIYEEQPNDIPEEFWEAMADLFNDWGAVQRLREILPNLLTDPLVFQCQKEPLEVQLRVQHIPSNDRNDSNNILF